MPLAFDNTVKDYITRQNIDIGQFCESCQKIFCSTILHCTWQLLGVVFVFTVSNPHFQLWYIKDTVPGRILCTAESSDMIVVLRGTGLNLTRRLYIRTLCKPFNNNSSRHTTWMHAYYDTYLPRWVDLRSLREIISLWTHHKRLREKTGISKTRALLLQAEALHLH